MISFPDLIKSFDYSIKKRKLNAILPFLERQNAITRFYGHRDKEGVLQTLSKHVARGLYLARENIFDPLLEVKENAQFKDQLKKFWSEFNTIYLLHDSGENIQEISTVPGRNNGEELSEQDGFNKDEIEERVVKNGITLSALGKQIKKDLFTPIYESISGLIDAVSKSVKKPDKLNSIRAFIIDKFMETFESIFSEFGESNFSELIKDQEDTIKSYQRYKAKNDLPGQLAKVVSSLEGFKSVFEIYPQKKLGRKMGKTEIKDTFEELQKATNSFLAETFPKDEPELVKIIKERVQDWIIDEYKSVIRVYVSGLLKKAVEVRKEDTDDSMKIGFANSFA